MIKLIATDLDGTLLREDKSFNKEFYDIFYKLKEKNIVFVIATGNQYELVKNRFDLIKDDLVYIVENGNKIVYQNKVLYTSILKQEDKENILNLLLEFEDLLIVYCGLKHSYISTKFQDKEDFLKLFLHNYVFVDDYKMIDDQIMKFSIADFNEESKKYVDIIKQQLPDHLQAVTTGTIWFDIFNKNVNKGTGLKFIQDYFHISKEECMAFGDQMNDYELLLNCEESYAMSNGVEKLKTIAKHIAKSNEEDGVIQVLKKLV
ncbi:HAD family hydrolase [Thomasclavelia saccharogumia]|uniref:HAD family hydrolase n=1 Tax=Thomasclavelia saccharogumia TaxID=341225 RepID=UPI00047CFE41|nr:HAD family hydrolase [Thomasclavelia saccharogumia]